MKKITLTKEQIALVDDRDFKHLNQWEWYSQSTNTGFYASRYQRKNEYGNGKRRQILMHRVILGINDKKVTIDHINGDTLDNRRENLRIATKVENGRNAGKGRNASSTYKGVNFHKGTKKWQANISNGRVIYLGLFEFEKDAAKAYDAKAKELFGEFARLNFPKEIL